MVVCKRSQEFAIGISFGPVFKGRPAAARHRRAAYTAEPIRSRGGKALGTMTAFLRQPWLKEHPSEDPSAHDRCANRLADHDAPMHDGGS
jgi:hypothetical protein